MQQQLQLGLVQGGPEPLPPIDSYQPVQLVTSELLERFWPMAAVHLDRCVKGALHGEYTTEDLYQMATMGKAVVFVVTNDPTGKHPDTDVSIAFVVEPVLYPKLNAVNILALGGHDLSSAQKQHWESFKGWAYMNGARAIEASVGPAMMRVLSRWGFKPVYTHARLSLEK